MQRLILNEVYFIWNKETHPELSAQMTFIMPSHSLEKGYQTGFPGKRNNQVTKETLRISRFMMVSYRREHGHQVAMRAKRLELRPPPDGWEVKRTERSELS
jgi:hypothetical protein